MEGQTGSQGPGLKQLLRPPPPQPAAGQKQQHREPPGQGGAGPPPARLQRIVPRLPCPDSRHLQAEALQCGRARLLPGEQHRATPKGPTPEGAPAGKVVPVPGLPSGWGISGLQAPHTSGRRASVRTSCPGAPFPSLLGSSSHGSECGCEQLCSGPRAWPELSSMSRGSGGRARHSCPGHPGPSGQRQKVKAWATARVPSRAPGGRAGGCEVLVGPGCGVRTVRLRVGSFRGCRSPGLLERLSAVTMLGVASLLLPGFRPWRLRVSPQPPERGRRMGVSLRCGPQGDPRGLSLPRARVSGGEGG